MSAGLLLTLAAGALAAGIALLMARLELRFVADIFAFGAGVLGVSAFASAAITTVRRARQGRDGMRRP